MPIVTARDVEYNCCVQAMPDDQLTLIKTIFPA